MPTAVLTIDGPGASNAVTSIEPETHRDLLRTHVEIGMADGKAVMTIDAEDTSAMRAALNSFLECLTVTENIEKITKATK